MFFDKSFSLFCPFAVPAAFKFRARNTAAFPLWVKVPVSSQLRNKAQAMVLFAALLALFASCSILEDRDSCPRLLHLDLSAPENQICDALRVGIFSAGEKLYEGVVPREDYHKGLDISFSCRGSYYVNVVDEAILSLHYVNADSGVRILHGGQCPQLYMYAKELDASVMEMRDTVSVCKNYCCVSLDFVAEDLDEYVVDIQGMVAGYGIDGMPLAGEFLYLPAIDNPSCCTFRLPRQVDASLKLGITPKSGGETKYFAVGNYILQSGYDWQKKNLDDICMSIDYSSTLFNLSVNGWEHQEIAEIEL